MHVLHHPALCRRWVWKGVGPRATPGVPPAQEPGKASDAAPGTRATNRCRDPQRSHLQNRVRAVEGVALPANIRPKSAATTLIPALEREVHSSAPFTASAGKMHSVIPFPAEAGEMHPIVPSPASPPRKPRTGPPSPPACVPAVRSRQAGEAHHDRGWASPRSFVGDEAYPIARAGHRKDGTPRLRAKPAWTQGATTVLKPSSALLRNLHKVDEVPLPKAQNRSRAIKAR